VLFDGLGLVAKRLEHVANRTPRRCGSSLTTGEQGKKKMARLPWHLEYHVVERLGWLRAAVLGANDGILSTSSLIIGVATAQGTHSSILIAGVSGLVAGAMSMAAGEYVSVSSQSDSERADIARESRELSDNREGELRELAGIYIKRGLEKGLALQVAEQLMARDALGAHGRDELGISEATAARPIQAALASAASFAVGAALPLAMAIVTPSNLLVEAVSITSLLFLAMLGAVGAKTGGASMLKASIRVTFWGAFAIAVAAAIGAVFGTQI
jgi:VIT1/CCC1 family predicted Fe2+/Mn2+ transporter